MRQGNPVRGYVYAWGMLCLDCWESSVTREIGSVMGERGRPLYQDDAERAACTSCGVVFLGPITEADFPSMKEETMGGVEA